MLVLTTDLRPPDFTSPPPPPSPPPFHPSHHATMEGRGLTLRSKSRRQRPQISAPKPISGPLPANTRAPEAGQAAIPAGRDRAPQSGATSDLVKRRYSTRFNAAPDFDANAPPVPSLPPPVPGGAYSGLAAPTAIPRQPSPADGSAPIPKVDLNALRDPSLPVERCMNPCGTHTLIPSMLTSVVPPLQTSPTS